MAAIEIRSGAAKRLSTRAQRVAVGGEGGRVDGRHVLDVGAGGEEAGDARDDDEQLARRRSRRARPRGLRSAAARGRSRAAAEARSWRCHRRGVRCRRRRRRQASAHTTGPAVRTWLPSGRPRTSGRRGWRRAARRGRSPVSIAHLVQHRDQVLGGDVAGRAGRDRAAAELAEARLEALDARRRARPARWRGPGRGCCGSGRSARRPAAARCASRVEVAHLARVGHARRVAEADLLARRRRPCASASSSTRSGGTWPS